MEQEDHFCKMKASGAATVNAEGKELYKNQRTKQKVLRIQGISLLSLST